MSKIVDTQLLLLSVAAQREDRIVTPPNYLQGRAARRALRSLLGNRFVEEIPAQNKDPIFRCDKKGCPISLRVTSRGLALIGLMPRSPIAGDMPAGVFESKREKWPDAESSRTHPRRQTSSRDVTVPRPASSSLAADR